MFGIHGPQPPGPQKEIEYWSLPAGLMLIPKASVQAPFQNPVKSAADAALELMNRTAAVATAVTCITPPET